MFERFAPSFTGRDSNPFALAFGVEDGASIVENTLAKDTVHQHDCACSACHNQKAAGSEVDTNVRVQDNDGDTGGDTSTQGKLTPGSFVIDEIETAGDNDWFSIDLVAGENYTFTVYLPGGGLRDSILTLRNSTGAVITTNDDANTQARLYYSEITFTATESATYFLDVSGFGQSTGQYVISSSRPVDDAIGDTAAESGSLTIDADATQAALEQTGDRDWYAVTLEAGESYVFSTSETGGANDVDTTLTLRDASGNVLGYNDHNVGTYSQIRFTATEAGVYYLDVGGWADGEQGDYQVRAAVAEPLAEFTNDQIAQQLLYGGSSDPNSLRRFDVTADFQCHGPFCNRPTSCSRSSCIVERCNGHSIQRSDHRRADHLPKHRRWRLCPNQPRWWFYYAGNRQRLH